METKNIETVSKLSRFTVLNDDLTRCRCNIFYTGRNRNRSDITEKALKTLIERRDYANKPVVAHLMKDKDGNYKVGGHDFKITITNDEVEYTDETVPFGVIPEDCNPAIEEFTETSGVKRNYFCVDLILWTHRYPIFEARYNSEIYFAQSMEAKFNKCYEDDDGYIVVDDMSISALCLLNKSDGEDNIEPCFGQSAVRKYSLDDNDTLKSGFNELLEKYENFKKKGGTGRMREKVLKALASEHFTDGTGEEHERYALISIDGDGKAGIFDRADCQAYTVSFTVTDEGGAVINYDSKVKCGITTCDEALSNFTISDEFNYAKRTAAKARQNELADGLARREDEINAERAKEIEAFNAMKAEHKVVQAKLEKYVKADEELKAKKHKEEIDTLIASYENDFKTFGGGSRYYTYAADEKRYAKSKEEVDNDLAFMLGKVRRSSKTPDIDLTAIASITEYSLEDRKPSAKRYGSLLDRVAKNEE